MRVVVILALSLFTLPAAAGPFGVRMTHFADPSTSVAISWNSDVATDNTLAYGTAPDALTSTLVVGPADTYPMPAPLGTGFSANLTGLTPATTYFYQVGTPGYPAEPLSFTTLGDDDCSALRFVVVGDNRADVNTGAPGVSDLYAGIMDETLSFQPHLFVNTGDMVKNGDVPEEWNNMIRASEATWARIPSITTQGNHDTGDPDGAGALYSRLFELPRNSAIDSEDYYSLDVGAVHFVSLNTQHLDTTELAEMSAWLDADLAATAQPWKVVFFHKAVYSRGNHFTGEEEDADGNQGVINRVLTPIFDAHDVDLVLNGHSHNYERYVPTVGFDAAFGGSGREFPAGESADLDAELEIPDGTVGTTYVVTGGGGARTTDIPGFDNVACVDSACTFCLGFLPLGGCDGDVLNVDQDQANVRYDGSHHFVAVEIVDGALHATVVATETGNNAGDIIDEFRIVKPSFGAQCGVAGEGEGEGEGDGGAGEGEGEGDVAGEGEGEGEGDAGNEGEGEGEGEPGSGLQPGDGPPGEVADVDCGCGAIDGVGPLGIALIWMARRRRSR